MSCRFCDIAQGRVKPKIVYEDHDIIAFLDRSPVNPGHTLLIPKIHINNVWDLEDELYLSIFKTAKIIAHSITTHFKPIRVGTLVSGFDVDHCHIHIIPMSSRDDVATRRVFENTWEEATQEALEFNRNKIKQGIENIISNMD